MLELDPQTATEVHATLAGRRTSLSTLLDQVRESGSAESFKWLVPVTPRTVHRLEGLRRLAAEHKISIQFLEPRGLSPAEAIFWNDFRRSSSSSARRRAGSEARRLAGELFDCIRHYRLGRKNRSVSVESVERAVLIGVYGGEHVGDAAILGGVVQDLHERCGTRRASLFSHRPEHTRNLIDLLSLPIEIEVLPYTSDQVRRALIHGDGLVMAGGPLMDLPRLLVKHYTAISIAKSQNKPFLIDRIGLGPFKRGLSRRMARRILLLADGVSVRASAALGDDLLAGIDARVGRDPAFDYLGSRSELSRLPDRDRAAVDSLLEDADDRRIVGINIRPIRHQWCPDGEEASKKAYHGFLQRLAEGLMRVDEASPRPPRYVFFPMNPMQLGQSDLASAYDLHRLVDGKVDLRVWEGDPSLDGVLYLLRRLDAAVAMRFHACIFAISQGLPTLGVDYYPGRRGKVLDLFADLGREDDATGIDGFNLDWFVPRMRAKLEPDLAGGNASRVGT